MAEADSPWVTTREMCEILKVSRSTLYRVRSEASMVKENVHFIRKNPIATDGASHILWHADRVAKVFARA